MTRQIAGIMPTPLLLMGTGSLWLGASERRVQVLDFTVRVYSAATGELLWQDQDQYDGGCAYAIAVNGNQVFVAGEVDYDFTVRAYNARTGELLWQNQYDASHDYGNARAIAVNGNRVFVAGDVTNEDTWYDFTVRVYSAATGELLWQDQYNNGTANEADGATAIAVNGNQVFVAGYVTNEGEYNSDFTVRAYNARTGELLWQDQYNGTANERDEAYAIAANGNRVFVAGQVTNEGTGSDFTVRAYSSATGQLLWQDQYDASNGWGWDCSYAIAVKENRVFVAGNVYNKGSGDDFTVRSYSARTGELLWQDQYDASNSGDNAYAIAVDGNRVFVAGSVWKEGTGSDFTVRAYRSKGDKK